MLGPYNRLCQQSVKGGGWEMGNWLVWIIIHGRKCLKVILINKNLIVFQGIQWAALRNKSVLCNYFIVLHLSNHEVYLCDISQTQRTPRKQPGTQTKVTLF